MNRLLAFAGVVVAALLLFLVFDARPTTATTADSLSDADPTAATPLEPASRVRVFDLMAQGKLSGLSDAADDAAPARRVDLVQEPTTERKLWFATVEGRSYDYTEEMGTEMTLTDAGGVEGGALRLGPGVERDRSYLVMIEPAKPMTRYRITGRVKLEGNPKADMPTSREVLRVHEHDRVVRDPTRSRRRGRFRPARPHRVSRTLDPSGWDRFELSFLTRPSTKGLEIRLLHRTGDTDAAATWYDNVVLEEQTVSEREIYDFVASGYRPHDGQEDRTPWRLRVNLEVGAIAEQRPGMRREYRDALLLPPPGRLRVPLTMPKADTVPQLQFHYGMLQESFGIDGDGAVISVSFEPTGGAPVAVGSVAFDPKSNRAHRYWQRATFDLTPVAGQTGELVFAVDDAPGTEPDVLDAVVISTPRIAPRDAKASGMNVIMIGVDTLRADRMSAFGYERDTSPNLARLADRGVRFSETRCQAPWTLPSFSTIMTSLYPSAHGAGRGGHDEWTPIDPTTTSLAEILSRYGYVTQGITANHLISPSYGLDQGFEAYRLPRGWQMESVQTDVDHVVQFLADNAKAPFFLFWHIMDPHLPYSTGDAFREQFTDASYDGKFVGRRGHSVPFGAMDPRPGRRWYTHEGPPPPPKLADTDRKFVHDYYDAEIAEVDAAIGRVLDTLEQLGLADNTIVSLVADHGEGLGDHNHYHHGYTLFDDQVHIPMIMAIPGKHEGKVIERPVGAIDLAPTILGALGLAIPEFFQGVDRLAEDAPANDAVILEYPTYDSSAKKGYVVGPLKYLHDPVFHTEELYDTRQDPGELNNIVTQHPDFVSKAKAALDQFRWEQLQKGRFHLRISAKIGQHVRVAVKTDDLFDANFVTEPRIDENHFVMNLDRTELVLDTTLEQPHLEFVFWCRGGVMDLEVDVDGKSLLSVKLGPGGEVVALPGEVNITTIPQHTSDNAGMPQSNQALLWLEAGASQTLPVVPTPEEIELLKLLGYAK